MMPATIPQNPRKTTNPSLLPNLFPLDYPMRNRSITIATQHHTPPPLPPHAPFSTHHITPTHHPFLHPHASPPPFLHPHASPLSPPLSPSPRTPSAKPTTHHPSSRASGPACARSQCSSSRCHSGVLAEGQAQEQVVDAARTERGR